MGKITVDLPAHRGYELAEDAEVRRLRARLAYEREVAKAYGEMATVGGVIMTAMTLLLIHLA